MISMLYKILNHIKAMTKSQWEMVRICWSHMLDPRHYILITKLFIWKPSITFLSLPQTSSVYESFVQIITYSLNSILLSFVSRTKPPRRFWSKAEKGNTEMESGSLLNGFVSSIELEWDVELVWFLISQDGVLVLDLKNTTWREK